MTRVSGGKGWTFALASVQSRGPRLADVASPPPGPFMLSRIGEVFCSCRLWDLHPWLCNLYIRPDYWNSSRLSLRNKLPRVLVTSAILLLAAMLLRGSSAAQSSRRTKTRSGLISNELPTYSQNQHQGAPAKAALSEPPALWQNADKVRLTDGTVITIDFDCSGRGWQATILRIGEFAQYHSGYSRYINRIQAAPTTGTVR